VTEGSEIYSFGIVLLELLTASPPAYVDGACIYRTLAYDLYAFVTWLSGVWLQIANWKFYGDTVVRRMRRQLDMVGSGLFAAIDPLEEDSVSPMAIRAARVILRAIRGRARHGEVKA